MPAQPLHVLHLIGSTGLYGAERWILALMRAVDADCVTSTLINLVDDDGETSAVVTAARQRGLNALDFCTGGRLNPFSAFRLARWAKAQGIDIIHGHGFKSDAVGLLAAKIAGCRVMTTPHGWSFEADKKLQLYEKLDRFLFRFMDMVCPLSPDLEQGIRGCTHPTRLRLIQNGVDIDEVQAIAPALRNDSNTFLIGYIGQLIERKDFSTLLAAVKLVRDGGATVKLLVIGDGTKKNALQEEAAQLGIAGVVEFLGFRPDAAAYLKTFDLFVLPSLMEGIPRCIMEAMAASVPVVASDIPGNHMIVSHGVTGLLFTPGDSRDLADKIRFMMSHPEDALKMAIRGGARVEDEYSSRKMAREYTALYHQLLAAQA